MRILTGRGNDDGEFRCTECGESLPGETPLQALERIATEQCGNKKKRIVMNYGLLGSHENPTERLPAVFVGVRGFFIKTVWNPGTREYNLG